MTATLPPWSYTMLSTFDECPRKALHRYILKEKEPSSPALEYGNQVHKALEQRIKGTPLPEVYMKYSPMAESIVNAYEKGMKVYAELKMGIRRDFSPCGFFDKDVWGRAAADVILKTENTIMVFDWKTGKKREKAEQVAILALFLFKHFPKATRIVGMNLWLETNEVGALYTFDRAHEAAGWRDVLPKIQRMEKALAEMAWPAIQGPLCGYCSVKTCQFNRS